MAILPYKAVDVEIELFAVAELRQLVLKDNKVDVFDPFLNGAFDVIVELTVGEELKKPVEGNEWVMLVPLPNGVVNVTVEVSLITEKFAEPVGIDKMLVSFPKGLALLEAFVVDVELVELVAEAVLTNSDNRTPI